MNLTFPYMVRMHTVPCMERKYEHGPKYDHGPMYGRMITIQSTK